MKQLYGWTKTSVRLPPKNKILIVRNNYDEVYKFYHDRGGEFYQSAIKPRKPENRIDNVYEWLEPTQDGFIIINGDEVNSIHAAIMKTLSTDQIIELRNKLIRRTPKDDLNEVMGTEDKIQKAIDWCDREINNYDIGHTLSLLDEMKEFLQSL
jgi:hypothetical protein